MKNIAKILFVVISSLSLMLTAKAGDMTVTPNSFALGTSFKIKQNGAIQCIWDSGEPGSVNSGKWYLLGFDSSGTTGATDFISINV